MNKHLGNSIEEKIKRLGEINAANEMIPIVEELRVERKEIVESLKECETIILDKNGGFHFVGDEKDVNKKIYLDSYNSF